MKIDNVHERALTGADPAHLAALLEGLGQEGDRLWPTASGRWPALRLDGPLSSLPAGGHGLVRYRVVEHEPGRRVVFRFSGDLGLDGTHRFEVLDGPRLRHTLEARATGAMRFLWPIVVRRAHDALLEELLDVAAAELGAPPERPVRIPLLTRALLALGPSPEREERMLAAQTRGQG